MFILNKVEKSEQSNNFQSGNVWPYYHGLENQDYFNFEKTDFIQLKLYLINKHVSIFYIDIWCINSVILKVRFVYNKKS